MVTLWDHYGIQFGATVVRVENNHVIEIKAKQPTKKGYVGLLVGAGSSKPKNVSKAMLVNFKKSGVEPKQKLVEFKVTKDAVLPVGLQLSARHFVPGQYLDVRGVTHGKGFQGGMKRHHFTGQAASHGCSVSHRSIGSTGTTSSPGRVFKGKKMPGRMGADNVCMQNLRLFKIDCKRNLLYIHGQVPGHRGNFVTITDALKRPPSIADQPPPMPTFIPRDGEPEVTELLIDQSKDPYVFNPVSRASMVS